MYVLLHPQNNYSGNHHLAHSSEIPADVRERYNSCKGYGAEGAKGATPQYWIDSARELGLQDLLESQGVNVFRNPLSLSPADEMDERLVVLVVVAQAQKTRFKSKARLYFFTIKI